jgi:hypothetical protein
MLAVLAGRLGAEDFWGRKLTDAPTNFIFGYGSLINSTSRSAKPEPASTIENSRVVLGWSTINMTRSTSCSLLPHRTSPTGFSPSNTLQSACYNHEERTENYWIYADVANDRSPE